MSWRMPHLTRRRTDFAASLPERSPYAGSMRKTLLLPVVLLAAGAARADIPAEHDVIFAGDFGLSYQHFTSSQGDGSIDLIRLAPSFDWVATKGLTIGAWLVYEHLSSTGSNSADDYGIIPRVGYVAELGPSVFIWPRAGIGYLHGLPDLVNVPISSSISVNRVQLDIDLAILYSPVPHFFIGGGPLFRTDLSSSSDSSGGVSIDTGKFTAFGLTFVIGGYF